MAPTNEPVLSIADQEALQRIQFAAENHAADKIRSDIAAANLLAAEKRTQELHEERHLVLRAAATTINVEDTLL
ncbi:hypothetical protein LTR17_007652, partial [Elasticomyces elasticus]